jgi:hypothetical protein
MKDSRPEPTLQLVRNLVEMLAPYEEELITAERVSPDVAYLRRAVSIAIAEACYWISDEADELSRPRRRPGDETPPAG